MAGWTEHRISTVLPVPLSFAYRWCTDFRPDDAHREGEKYQRRILERGRRRVVYEDLESTPTGWRWTRHDVRLAPPDRWHSDSVGNYRDVRIDYSLTALGPMRTRITLVWKRRPTALAGRPPSRRATEASTLAAWRLFASALASDYRRSRRR